MDTRARRPDFFIVGAPKCGTTALYTYLQRHPDVFMSQPKEPQFFAEDIFEHQRNVTTLAAYMKCFAAANGQKRIGEASTAYLGSQGAVREIKGFCPEARIIIMLRNPVDVMYAQHSERLFAGSEHIRDFNAAVDSSDKRTWLCGPFQGEKVIRLSYRELSRYAEPVARHFDAFGRENVHVIIYDDFRTNAQGVFAEVLRFLDVRPAPEVQCEVINENRRARNFALQRFIDYPPKSARAIARKILPRSARSALGKTLERCNAVHEPRVPLAFQLRTLLQIECKADVDALSRLINRDLSHWYENRS